MSVTFGNGNDVLTVKFAAQDATSNPALSLEEKRNAWRRVLNAIHREENDGYVSYCRAVRLSEHRFDAIAHIQTITKMIVAQRNAQ